MPGKVLYFSSRVLAILFICFLTLFSLDVFGGPSPWYMQWAGFLVHSIPSFIFIIVLVVAWKRPEAGWIYFVLGALLLFLVRGPIETGLLFAGVQLVTGALFLLQKK